MNIVLALGSNLGDRKNNLEDALEELTHHFKIIAQSRIYQSGAVEIKDQPDFFNQVIECETQHSPTEVLEIILKIEQKLGRVRTQKYGPRTIDIDLIFYEMLQIKTDQLTLPHPKWSERSFVVRPLQELPFYETVKKCFTLTSQFEVEAFPIS